MRESAIEKALKKWTDERGILNYKFVSPSHRGVPDRLFIRNGRCAFVEFKAPGQKITALQQFEIDRLRRAGAFATWSSGLEEAKMFIKLALHL